MTELEQLYYIAELLGVLAIFGSLIFVGLQMRQSNRVNAANARHAISDQALQLIAFQATHSDRLAKIARDRHPDDSDLIFMENVYRMTFQLAENYYTQYGLGLMPEDHWQGFAKFIEDMLGSRRARQFWDSFRDHYGGDFASWVDGLIDRR